MTVINGKTKTMMPFRKWTIDMTIQSTNLLCIMLQGMKTSYLATKHSNRINLRVSPIREKPVIFLVSTTRDGTFALTETLLI